MDPSPPVRISTAMPSPNQASGSHTTSVTSRGTVAPRPVQITTSGVPSTPSSRLFTEPLVPKDAYGKPTNEDKKRVAAVLGCHGQSIEFRTHHQFQHYKLLLERKYCVISVAPTGAGKTLPILLAAHAWGPGVKMVIGLPYVALYDEYIARFQCAGMAASVFNKSNENPTTQIVLVSINSFSSALFRTVLSQWAKDRVLGAIVLDEAHGIIEDVGFRSEFKAMMQIILTLPNTTVHFLSATIPQPYSRVFFEQIGLPLDSTVVLRSHTQQPSLSWQFYNMKVNAKLPEKG